jgi:hypothetical protein
MKRPDLLWALEALSNLWAFPVEECPDRRLADVYRCNRHKAGNTENPANLGFMAC